MPGRNTVPLSGRETSEILGRQASDPLKVPERRRVFPGMLALLARVRSRDTNAPTGSLHCYALLAVLLTGLAVLSAATMVWGPTKKFVAATDSSQYLHIAMSLARGKGFKDPDGLWPDRPDCGRMPAWPAVIAVGLRLAPWASPEAVDRFSGIFCLALAGVFFAIITQFLGVRPLISVFAGLAVSLSPSLIYLAVEGMSEPAFVMMIGTALACMLTGGWLGAYAGAIVMGLAALNRSNTLVVVPAVVGLALLSQKRRVWLFHSLNWARCAILCVLAMAPSALWVLRNYSASGQFPVISALEGEALYGSNNDVVANDLGDWGYWVVPNKIPGETAKPVLGTVLHDDVELNDYYHHKAITWVRGHLSSIPRLELGKFIRAFVPIPWVPLVPSYAAFFARFLLYVLASLFLPLWWRGIDRRYRLAFAAMALVHLWTTAVYYGCFRFTHCFVEILLVPCIAVGAQRWLADRSR